MDKKVEKLFVATKAFIVKDGNVLAKKFAKRGTTLTIKDWKK